MQKIAINKLIVAFESKILLLSRVHQYGLHNERENEIELFFLKSVGHIIIAELTLKLNARHICTCLDFVYNILTELISFTCVRCHMSYHDNIIFGASTASVVTTQIYYNILVRIF